MIALISDYCLVLITGTGAYPSERRDRLYRLVTHYLSCNKYPPERQGVFFCDYKPNQTSQWM